MVDQFLKERVIAELSPLKGSEFDDKSLAFFESHPDRFDEICFGINEVLKGRTANRIIPEHFEIPFHENASKSEKPEHKQELKIMSLLSLNLLERAEIEMDLLNKTYGKSVYGEVLFATLSWLKGELTPHDFLKNEGRFSSFESEKIQRFFDYCKEQSLNAQHSGHSFFGNNIERLQMRFDRSAVLSEPEVVRLIHGVTVLSLSLGTDKVNANWMYYHSLRSKISGYKEILPDPSRITLDQEQEYSPEVLALIGANDLDIKLSTTHFNDQDMCYSELASLRPIRYEVEPNPYINNEQFWLLMVQFKGSEASKFNIVDGVGKVLPYSLLKYCNIDEDFSFKYRYMTYFGELYDDAVAHRKSLYEKAQNPSDEIILPDRVVEGLYIVEQLIKGNYDLNNLGKFGTWIKYEDIRLELIPLCAWYALDLHDLDFVGADYNDFRNGVLMMREVPGKKLSIPDYI